MRFCSLALGIVPILLQGLTAQAPGALIQLDLAEALESRKRIIIRDIGPLSSRGGQEFHFDLARTESLDLRVPFSEAPFNGTQLNVLINGHRLLPYFAFGGDTRYDSVKGKPGMWPPVATIEGHWLIPARWLHRS